jgi:hypothetical protein
MSANNQFAKVDLILQRSEDIQLLDISMPFTLGKGIEMVYRGLTFSTVKFKYLTLG